MRWSTAGVPFAIRYSNFANLLHYQGTFGEDERLYRRAIEIGEMALGKDHPDVAIRYNNLASLLRDQGKYREAEPLFRRATEIAEAKLGAEPHTRVIKMNYDQLMELKNQTSE